MVTMKIKAAKTGLSPDLEPVESFMESSFPSCVQREKHYNTLQYEIASSSMIHQHRKTSLVFSTKKITGTFFKIFFFLKQRGGL